MIPDVSTLPAGEVFTMTRRFRASLSDLWALWTTAKGIESWWGPPGFAVTVQSIDLQPGGLLHYTMTAHQPEMVAFMQANNMPVATKAQITYGEVTPLKRLAYSHLVDFVPGQAPYSTALAVDFRAEGDIAEMHLTFQRMHDAEWTETAAHGLGPRTRQTRRPARWRGMSALRRGFAVAAGFGAVAILSVGTDSVMHAAGIFPPGPEIMPDPLFILPALYRALFTILGGMIATLLAGDRSYLAAKILSGFGLLGGMAGVFVWFTADSNLGPLWYTLTIPISAIPCTLAGAWLILRRSNGTRIVA